MTIIAVTGASGNLGSKLTRHLARREDVQLRLLDIKPGADGVVQDDLSLYDDRWIGALKGADVIVHLAANPRAEAGWGDLVGPNVDAVLNLYLAAVSHGVRKIVLASSVWAMASRREDDHVILAGEPAPGGNAYGASKLFGERIGKAFAHAHGIATIAVRIGGCRPGSNPCTVTGDAWEDGCWLSNLALCQGLERAIAADAKGFSVINLVSDGAGSRWSLDEARERIGYQPAQAPVARAGQEHIASRVLTRARSMVRHISPAPRIRP